MPRTEDFTFVVLLEGYYRAYKLVEIEHGGFQILPQCEHCKHRRKQDATACGRKQ